MKRKNFLIVILAGCIGLLFSCSKPAEPVLHVPAPEPALETFYRVTRQFQYFSGKTASKEYETAGIGYKASFHKDSSILELNFAADTLRDQFHFEIRTEIISQKGVFSFPVLQKMDNLGDGFVTYIYHQQPSASRLFPGNMYPWEGYINILSYDAKRKLITGNWYIFLKDSYDPVSGNLKERCSISLEGWFNNIKYEEVQ